MTRRVLTVFSALATMAIVALATPPVATQGNGVPALVITAEDDPFVPSQAFRDPRVAGNPYISLIVCQHGGHCGFVGPASGGDDGYWADKQVVDFVERGATATAGPTYANDDQRLVLQD